MFYQLLQLSQVITCAILLALPGLAPAADRYTDHNDGTVTDTTTGLMWMRCALGQTWTGAACSGTASYTWNQAMALTSTFAGHNDWYVPNIRELQTIVDRTTSNPAIDASIFPNTPSAVFWSASARADSSGSAWVVYFNYGSTFNISKSFSARVRLVRAGQCFEPFLCNSLNSIKRPTSDYVDHSNGTATHTPSCLMWQRCAQGQTWNGSTCTGTAQSYNWAAANNLLPFPVK